MIKADVQNLQPWKEALTRLSENHFLDLVRMYAGAIKTPYNKERLINELIAFLHKAENRQTLLALLSENDIVILNAVVYIPNIDREKLTTFFSGQFSAAVLYEYLMNLEERLILFRPIDRQTGKESFAINPLLTESLKSLLNISVLLPLPQVAQKKELNQTVEYEDYVPTDGQSGLSARLLVSWFAFIAENPSACRSDGSFKKKTFEQITEIFHGVSADFLLKLNTALVNLFLFLQDGNNLVINESKWRAFSILPAKVQYAYIAAASYNRIPRDTLVKYAIFAASIASSIPKEGYTRSVLLRSAFFMQDKQISPMRSQSRYFSQILEKAANNQKSSESFSNEALIDVMLLFGLLSVSGQDAKGEDIIVCSQNDVISNQKLDGTYGTNFSSSNENARSISIDAGFTVTLLRELPVSILFDLVQCMDLASFDTVCRFTITRSACMRCFDRGVNTQDIFHSLEKAAGYALPQNLTFSIEEWHNAYNAGSLFKGYVLQVSPDKQVLVENNPILAPYIKMTFVPGIYLLDFAGDEDAISAIQKSGLDFIGMPKKLNTEQESLPFANFLQSPTSINEEFSEKSMDEVVKQGTGDCTENTVNVLNLHDNERERHLKEMKDTLETLNLPSAQKEGLLLRIERKIILTPTQLRGESVRVERTEASGMDFVGKVYVIEQAIAASNMIEVTSGTIVYLGLPTGIAKRAGEATLTMVLENEQESVTFSIGQIRSVKRFRGSLFKEKR